MFNFIMYLSILILSPVITFLHEMGHALPTLIFTQYPVKIIMGADKGKYRTLKLGQLTIELRSYSLFTGGFCRYEGSVSRKLRLAILAGGPVVSLLTFTSILLISMTITVKGLVLSAVLNGIFYMGLFQFLWTILPITYKLGDHKGHTSDGKKLIILLKNN